MHLSHLCPVLVYYHTQIGLFQKKYTPTPPMDGKLEILTGGGGDGSGNPGRRGGSEPKNSSLGVTFNFNLDRYILTT